MSKEAKLDLTDGQKEIIKSMLDKHRKLMQVDIERLNVRLTEVEKKIYELMGNPFGRSD